MSPTLPQTPPLRRALLVGALSAFAGCVAEEPTPGCSPEGLDAAPTCEAWPQLCHLAVQRDQREPDARHAVDVVFVPEGFAADEMGDFRDRVRALTAALDADPGTLFGREPARFNRYTLDLPSAGTVSDDDPHDTPLHGCFRADALDAAGTPLLAVQPELALFSARQSVPEVDVVVVLFNTRGGRANAPLLVEPLVPTGLVLVNLANAARVLDHELGHALVHLGDEYTDVDGCFGATLNPPPAPSSPGDWWNSLEFTANLSVDPGGARWRGLVAGALEGGARYGRCVYHPTARCRMGDDAEAPFCPVCDAAVERTLRRYRTGVDDTPPACGLYVAAATGDRFAVCPRATAFRGAARFRIRGPHGEHLLDGTSEPAAGSTSPSLGLGRGCAMVDASAWDAGPQTVTIDCWSDTSVGSSNALTLDVRHGG